MNKLIIPIIVVVIIIACISAYFVFQKPAFSGPQIPYYFIAIHNEPAHGIPNGRQIIEQNYVILKQMIARANQYNIRITLMFTAQWVDYITESPERMAELEQWKKQGHEIAAHHHSIYHGNWDGYTDYTKEEAIAQRISQNHKPEEYLGTLEYFIEKLKKINPNIKSGCVNDERDKRAMPDEIIYDTCSGFANYGEPGTREGDATNPEKGKNEYVTIGIYNGIERKWLTHYQVTKDDRQKAAQQVFDLMDSGVYGAVTHSIQNQAIPYYDFLEFLHSKDPEGKKSRTVSEIIDQKLLPEETISTDLLNQPKPQQPEDELGKCGDGVCGPAEKENDICPEDCGSTTPSTQGKCGDGICDKFEKSNPRLCPEDCQPTQETETCSPDSNGYCIDFREKCKQGYESIGPDKCKAGKTAQCCVLDSSF